MKKMHAIGILMTLLLALTLVSAVSAADDDPVQTVIDGTIIGVDPETGDLYVLQNDGTIVTINSGGYEHPIVELLAEYFGESGDADWLTAATEALATDLELEEGQEIVSFTPVIDETGITGWLITVADAEGETTEFTTDPAQTTALSDALVASEDLGVSLPTTGDGDTVNLYEVGDEIAAYHEDGIGFGVLVKIYAIAQESEAACEGDPDPDGCMVTVEYLVELLDGTGMGNLFATYGKPSLLGVGHVRQALRSAGGGEFVDDGGDGGDDGGDGGGGGVCHAREQGGNANANGQDISCD